MGIKAKLGAGEWDMLTCEECGHQWASSDVNYEWTDDPEDGGIECPGCSSPKVVREERG